MKISPSQLINYTSCHRKWWFRSCHKLKDGKDPAARDTGTVLHEVAGRWLDADDQGRDRRTGQPVDLYPPGWERVREFGRDTGRAIDLQQQAIVRIAVQKAIENGVLRRLPARQVERRMEIEVVPGVVMEGYIDQDAPVAVEDHKTTKSRKWALSKAKLAKDEKMLCYAVMRHHESPGDAVTLRLNYFDKSNAEPPWAVEARIKPDAITNFEDTVIKPSAEGMKTLREAKLPIEQWADVDGPQKKGACEEYGGCPYAKICARVMTVQKYQETLDRPQLTQQQREQVRSKKTTMSHFKKRPKPNATQVAAVPEQAAATTPTENPATAPVKVIEQEAPSSNDTPPWAVASCRACKGKGINGAGEPCRACDVVQGRTNGVTSSQYEIWVDDAGVLRWKPAGGTTIVPEPKADPKPAAAKKTKEKPKEAAPVTQVVPEDPAKGRIETTVFPITKEQLQQGIAALNGGGFHLHIGCMPMRPGVMITTIADILADEGDELAEAAGKANYYEMNAFERRDAIASRAEEISKGLAGAVFVASEMTPDERSLVTALTPFAREVTIRV